MTELDARAKVVDIAVSHLGQKESNGTHRAIIDRYNAQAVLPRGYKVTYTDAWCATFVSVVSLEAGFEKIMPTECSCPQMVTLYKALGRWVENDAYVPKPGDIIMYDWQDSGSGDNQGTPDHVGIVVSASERGMKIIEGNLNNAVGYRSIPVNSRYIRGYCVPDYAKICDDAEDECEGGRTAMYQKIESVPDWARATVEKLVSRGLLLGDENGDLNLTADMVRILVILDRAGVFGQ